MIKCMVCGKEMKMLNNRHLDGHSMTMDQYKEKFPESETYSKESKEKIKANATKINVSRKGVKRTDEERAAMRDGQKRFYENGGKPANKGKPMAEEQKEILRQLAYERNKKWNEEGNHPLVGVKHSDERKENIRKACQVYANNHKDMMSLKGKKSGEKRREHLKVKINSIIIQRQHASKESTKNLSRILSFCEENHIRFYFGQFEYMLFDEIDKKRYFYDLVIPDYNMVIEYNGNPYHPNPYELTDEEWNRWSTTKNGALLTANECVDYDYKKAKLIYNKRGYFVWYITRANLHYVDMILDILRS